MTVRKPEGRILGDRGSNGHFDLFENLLATRLFLFLAIAQTLFDVLDKAGMEASSVTWCHQPLDNTASILIGHQSLQIPMQIVIDCLLGGLRVIKSVQQRNKEHMSVLMYGNLQQVLFDVLNDGLQRKMSQDEKL